MSGQRLPCASTTSGKLTGDTTAARVPDLARTPRVEAITQCGLFAIFDAARGAMHPAVDIASALEGETLVREL